nr:hypothetical protein [[Eubacterium] cellulosolvens]
MNDVSYAKLTDPEDDVQEAADQAATSTDTRLSHEEEFDSLWRKIEG